MPNVVIKNTVIINIARIIIRMKNSRANQVDSINSTNFMFKYSKISSGYNLSCQNPQRNAFFNLIRKCSA